VTRCRWSRNRAGCAVRTEGGDDEVVEAVAVEVADKHASGLYREGRPFGGRHPRGEQFLGLPLVEVRPCSAPEFQPTLRRLDGVTGDRQANPFAIAEVDGHHAGAAEAVDPPGGFEGAVAHATQNLDHVARGDVLEAAESHEVEYAVVVEVDQMRVAVEDLVDLGVHRGGELPLPVVEERVHPAGHHHVHAVALGASRREHDVGVAVSVGVADGDVADRDVIGLCPEEPQPVGATGFEPAETIGALYHHVHISIVGGERRLAGPAEEGAVALAGHDGDQVVEAVAVQVGRFRPVRDQVGTAELVRRERARRPHPERVVGEHRMGFLERDRPHVRVGRAEIDHRGGRGYVRLQGCQVEGGHGGGGHGRGGQVDGHRGTVQHVGQGDGRSGWLPAECIGRRSKHRQGGGGVGSGTEVVEVVQHCGPRIDQRRVRRVLGQQRVEVGQSCLERRDHTVRIGEVDPELLAQVIEQPFELLDGTLDGVLGRCLGETRRGRLGGGGDQQEGGHPQSHHADDRSATLTAGPGRRLVRLHPGTVGQPPNNRITTPRRPTPTPTLPLPPAPPPAPPPARGFGVHPRDSCPTEAFEHPGRA
jgi:hypothetical protein